MFNSIFVHRSRDFYEEVRITAMRHLLTFVRFDPVHPVRVDALKYLGWGCGDYAAAVRLESIRAIQELVQVCICFSLLQIVSAHTFIQQKARGIFYDLVTNFDVLSQLSSTEPRGVALSGDLRAALRDLKSVV